MIEKLLRLNNLFQTENGVKFGKLLINYSTYPSCILKKNRAIVVFPDSPFSALPKKSYFCRIFTRRERNPLRLNEVFRGSQNGESNMIRKKSEILGFYVPAFFEMHLDTNNSIDLNVMSDKDLSVFFHEYIHFLQDFTTYYGLNNIYVYSEYISSVINRLYKQEKGCFLVPFEINDNADNVLLNKLIANISLGDSQEVSSFQIQNIRIEDFSPCDNPTLNAIPDVILTIKQGNKNGEDDIIFGAMAIMENMAYLMERLCFPKAYSESPDFPYTAAEKVSDYYVPNFSNSPLMVLALCDMSLQCSCPGKCYVEIMKGIQRGSLVFNKPEEIYDHFYSLKSVTAYGENYSFIEQYDLLLDTVSNKLKGYVKEMPQITIGYYSWINKLRCFAKKWRENDGYLLLKIANGGNLKNNTHFQQVINATGTPIMGNNSNDYYKVPLDINNTQQDMEYLKAVGMIANLFEKGDIECSLYEWCKKSKISIDDRCQNEPWQRVTDDNLCPFALLWRHWNLTGHIPTVSDKNEL